MIRFWCFLLGRNKILLWSTNVVTFPQYWQHSRNQTLLSKSGFLFIFALRRMCGKSSSSVCPQSTPIPLGLTHLGSSWAGKPFCKQLLPLPEQPWGAAAKDLSLVLLGTPDPSLKSLIKGLLQKQGKCKGDISAVRPSLRCRKTEMSLVGEK